MFLSPGAVEACLLHRLKKRAGGLLPPSDCSVDLLQKITKLCPDAQSINILTNYLYQVQETKNTFPSLNEKTGMVILFLWWSSPNSSPLKK